MGFFDPRYIIFMMPAFILMLLVQFYVSSAYRKWSQVQARSRISGAEAAQRLIKTNGLYNVRIESIAGNLSDHYDPRKKVLRLSTGTYHSNSIAALSIAAHELGHAIQDSEGYFPLRLRAALVPAVNIGSYLGWILLLIGLLLGFTNLALLGLIVFSAGAFFALATLPVELNASARARRMLLQSGLIVGKDEMSGVNNVLNAAALTYVAALITAIMQLLYYATLIFGMGGRRRN